MSKRSLLLVPALMALSPLADAAVEINEGDLSLKFGGRLQARVEMANGTNADGSDWAPSGGIDGGEIDFSLRRIRFTTKGTYKEHWKFVLDFEADKQGTNESVGDSDLGIEEIRLTYDMGDTEINFGHYKPWFNMADKISSGSKMFMEDAPNDQFEGSKSVGIGVFHDAGIVRFGFDLKNQDADDGLDKGGDSTGDLQFTARVETGLSEEQNIKKLKESSAGSNEGFHHNLGFEIGLWTDADDADGGETEANVFTIDYIAYIDQISLGAYLTVGSEDDGSTDTDSQILTLFAGYAIPSDDIIYEPAIRLAMIDKDTDNDDEAVGPNGTTGGWNSGTLIDLVCNIYQDGHNSKTQIGLELWSAEDGDGDSTIFRVQQTLSF